MVRVIDYKKTKKTRFLPFKNVARDFHQEMVFFKKLPSGNIKVGEVVGGGAGRPLKVIPRVAKKVDKNKYRVYEGGSPFNTYYYYGKV